MDELNEQVKHELFAAHYYLAMAAYCASEDLDGFENFFLVQAEEEKFHAMKIYNFINDVGERVEIKGLDKPKNDFKSLQEVLELALEHEKSVTSRINMLMDLAAQEKNYKAMSFLQWFVDEQVEEEDLMGTMLNRIKRVGDSGQGIMMLDREAAQRTFTPPAEEDSN